jgi:hypothetical protein
VAEHRRAVFDPESGERRLRMIEDADEYARVRRLHPQADETLLRALRDDLEDRFASASALFASNGHPEGNGRSDWQKLLDKWDQTLSNALQLAPQKGTYARTWTRKLKNCTSITWPSHAMALGPERREAAE